MPGKSPSLTEQIRRLELAFQTYKEVTDFRIQRQEVRDAEHSRREEELRNKIADLTAQNASLQERLRNQEKLSDRGWQGWLALIGAGLALLVAFLKN